MSRNVCVVIESPTFRLGELLCLLEELRRRHLLVRGRRAAAASATAEQVHAELVHGGKVWIAPLNENNDNFDFSVSLSVTPSDVSPPTRRCEKRVSFLGAHARTRSLALARSHPRSLFPRTAGQLVIDDGG